MKSLFEAIKSLQKSNEDTKQSTEDINETLKKEKSETFNNGLSSQMQEILLSLNRISINTEDIKPTIEMSNIHLSSIAESMSGLFTLQEEVARAAKENARENKGDKKSSVFSLFKKSGKEKEEKPSLGKIGGLFAGIGSGLKNMAIGVATLGAAIPAFFGGLLVGEKLLGADWLQGASDFTNIKKAATGFVGIIKEFYEDKNALLALGGIMGLGVFASFKTKNPWDVGIGMASIGAGIAGFFLGLQVGESLLSGISWLGADYNFNDMKVAMEGFSSMMSTLSSEAIVALGGIIAIGSFTAFKAKNPWDVGLGVASIGAGITGFLLGLMIGELALGGLKLANIDIDFNKTGEAIQGFASIFTGIDAKGLTVLGILFAVGATIGTFGSVKSISKAVLGIAAIGAGIATFFMGFGLAEGGLDALKVVDFNSVTAILKGFGEAIDAMSWKSLEVLGGLMAGGALIGLFGIGASAGAASGIAAIGLGIAAFLLAFGGVSKVLNIIGADGSGIRDLLINTSKGLDALSTLNGENLLKSVTAMALIGPAMTSMFAGDLIGTIQKGWEGLKSIFGSDEGFGESIVTMLKPLNDLDVAFVDKLTLISDSLYKLTGLDFSSTTSQLKELSSSLVDFYAVTDTIQTPSVNHASMLVANVKEYENQKAEEKVKTPGNGSAVFAPVDASKKVTNVDNSSIHMAGAFSNMTGFNVGWNV